MLDAAQSILMLLVGTLLVIFLVWVLVLVHKQANRIRQIENHLSLVEKAEEERHRG